MARELGPLWAYCCYQFERCVRTIRTFPLGWTGCMDVPLRKNGGCVQRGCEMCVHVCVVQRVRKTELCWQTRVTRAVAVQSPCPLIRCSAYGFLLGLVHGSKGVVLQAARGFRMLFALPRLVKKLPADTAPEVHAFVDQLLATKKWCVYAM